MKKNGLKFKIFSTLILVIVLFLCFNITSIFALEETSTTETNQVEEEASENALPPETVLASFGTQTITLGEFNQLWEQIPDNYKLQLTKNTVLEQMISENLLLQEAKNIGLEQDKEVLEAIQELTEQILVQTLIEREILEKTKISDEEAEKYYTENISNFIEKEQVHLFNILVETEEEAQNILEQLKNGIDFSEIAKEKSTGPSAAQGGDLGLVSKGAIIPEIEEVIFALEVDKVSEIVKTDFGFHILKISDKIPEITKTLEEVKEEIVTTLLPLKQQEAFDALVEDLKSRTEIQINEEALQ